MTKKHESRVEENRALQRVLTFNPNLKDRRFGMPSVGVRTDKKVFNPAVQALVDATEYYGYRIQEIDKQSNLEIDLGSGDPIKIKPFPLAIKEMKKSLSDSDLYNYPYAEGNIDIRRVLLGYIKQEGFLNNNPYKYKDIDEKGLSVHNIICLPSTTMAFNYIISCISNPGDVVLITGPNYGLFTINAERVGAEVEIIPLEEKDNWYINPQKLAKRIDEINNKLQLKNKNKTNYVPKVVGFLNMNPHNPTGKVMGAKEEKLLKAIGKVCLERDVFLIDDMVYRDITFDKNNIAKPIATIPGMFKNTITLFGLSKSYGMANLRAGFVIADEIIIRSLINRIFQEMDAPPDIIGRALSGAFNATKKRNKVYDSYFSKLRTEYKFRYNLLNAFVKGIDSIKDKNIVKEINNKLNKVVKNKKTIEKLLKGLPYTDFVENLKPESGFFAILNFTKITGKVYREKLISNEKDLLDIFYQTTGIKFLIGKSISWPNKNEIIGRFSFAVDEKKFINAFIKMNELLYEIKKNN